MNPGRFYMPNYMGMRSGSFISPMLRMANSAPRGVGIFSKITNGIRSVNWGNLLNGANKTLNVVNQTIPLVRQAGPMVNNMKSMLRIAKAFGSETVKNDVNSKNIKNNMSITKKDNNNNKNSTINNANNYQLINSDNNEKFISKKEVYDNNYPSFFV